MSTRCSRRNLKQSKETYKDKCSDKPFLWLLLLGRNLENSKLENLERICENLAATADALAAQLEQLKNSTTTEISRLKVENNELQSRIVEIETRLQTQALNRTTVWFVNKLVHTGYHKVQSTCNYWQLNSTYILYSGAILTLTSYCTHSELAPPRTAYKRESTCNLKDFHEKIEPKNIVPSKLSDPLIWLSSRAFPRR